MKILKGALVTGILISGLSSGAPYERENVLNPAWYEMVGNADEAPMCKVEEKKPLCLDNAIEAQEAQDFILHREVHQH